MVGAVRAVTVRSPCATTLVSHSEPLAPCPAALPHAAAIGAAIAVLCYRRLTIASAPPCGSAPLSALSVALLLLRVHLAYPWHRHMAIHAVASAHKGAAGARAMSVADARTPCP